MGALDRAMFAHFRDPAKLTQITTLLESATVRWHWPMELRVLGDPLQWAGSLDRFRIEMEKKHGITAC